MTTIRQFILAGSALATGNTIRDHLNNPLISGAAPPRINHTARSDFTATIPEKIGLKDGLNATVNILTALSATLAIRPSLTAQPRIYYGD